MPPRHANPNPARAATLTEVLAVLVCCLAAFALMVPVLAQVSHDAPVSGSMHNLRVLHEALACYAADWNDRQFTAVPDDLGIVGGDCDDYVDQCGCWPTLWAGRSVRPGRSWTRGGARTPSRWAKPGRR